MTVRTSSEKWDMPARKEKERERERSDRQRTVDGIGLVFSLKWPFLTCFYASAQQAWVESDSVKINFTRLVGMQYLLEANLKIVLRIVQSWGGQGIDMANARFDATVVV